jgi:hypothetical protein
MRTTVAVKQSWYRPVARVAEHVYYTWARHDLQRKNPAHPDMPQIVLKLRSLESEWRGSV